MAVHVGVLAHAGEDLTTKTEEKTVVVLPKVVASGTLEEVCRRAERQGFDLGPNEKLWQVIDPAGRHLLNPVALGTVLTGADAGRVSAVRCHLLVKVKGTMKPVRVLVDLLPQDFFGLPDSPTINQARRQAPRRTKRAARRR